MSLVSSLEFDKTTTYHKSYFQKVARRPSSSSPEREIGNYLFPHRGKKEEKKFSNFRVGYQARLYYCTLFPWEIYSFPFSSFNNLYDSESTAAAKKLKLEAFHNF